MNLSGKIELSKYFFKRLISKPTEVVDVQKELQEYRAKISKLQREITALISWKDRYSSTLGILTESMNTLVWSKDELGHYTLANARHCQSFFGLEDPVACIHHIVGKTDTELLEEAKKERGLRSSFGAICALSDKYTKEKNKVCHFLEAGVVNDEEVLLYVVKTPRTGSNGEFIGSVGFAWDFTDNSSYMVTQLNRLIYDDKATKLFQCDKVFAYALEPAEKKCAIFQHICPGTGTDCPNGKDGCGGNCDVKNRLEEC